VKLARDHLRKLGNLKRLAENPDPKEGSIYFRCISGAKVKKTKT
jgi:hypothetical protein